LNIIHEFGSTAEERPDMFNKNRSTLCDGTNELSNPNTLTIPVSRAVRMTRTISQVVTTQNEMAHGTPNEIEFPTEGDVWEMWKDHVLDNTDDSEKLEYIAGDSVRINWSLGELYDKKEIVEYIRNNDIPPEAIYTSTQLSHSCGRLNKEILADNERIRVKHNQLIAKYTELQAKHNQYNELQAKYTELQAKHNQYNELQTKIFGHASHSRRQPSSGPCGEHPLTSEFCDKTKKEECRMQ